jgi:peptide-methionine (S)-S-oxide reductase
LQRGGELTLAAAVVLDMADKIDGLLLSSDQQQQLIAVTAASFYGKTKALKSLLDKGADPNGYPGASGFHGHATPLHQAVSSGSLHCVQLLTEAGAKLDVRDKIYDGTPLDWAKYLQGDATDDDAKSNFASVQAYLQQRSP